MSGMGEEWEDLELPGSMAPYRVTTGCSFGGIREPDPLMTCVIAVLGIVFAAFCIWLTVRFVNRRERWAKWTLVAAVTLPVLYIASFGPTCWIASRLWVGHSLVPYRPIIWAAVNDLVDFQLACDYAELFAAEGTQFLYSMNGDDCWMDAQ